MTYLSLHAIQLAQKENKLFDFEGSMMEGVEQRNRQFGAKQTPYFQIKKLIQNS